MERHIIEGGAPTELREISVNDEDLLRKIAELITKHSWGEEYPINPLDELRQSEYILGAYIGSTLAGVGTVNRVASPDGIDNGEIWFGNALVLPEHESKGIYTELYEARLEWVGGKEGRVLCCTDNPKIDGFLLKRGWRKIRDTKDEAGDPCRVYELDR